MVQQYLVTGTVSYANDRGWRLDIPLGQVVEVDRRDFEDSGTRYAATMTWTDHEGRKWIEKWAEMVWAQNVKFELKEVQTTGR